MTGLRVLAMLIGLADPGAEVTAATLDVYDAPGAAAMRTGKLRRGARVRVRGEESGWLAIEPPRGSFSWIEETAIEETEAGRARVVADRAPVRPGSPAAKLPGPPGVELERGAAVILLNRPPVTIRRRGSIPDLGGDRGAEVGIPLRPGRRGRSRRAAARRRAPLAADEAGGPGDRRPRTRGPARPSGGTGPRAGGDRGGAPTGPLRGPLETWQLGPIRDAYRDLLGRQTGPAARAAVQARLDQVDRQARLAQEARSFLAVVDRSRRRDAGLGGGPDGEEPPTRSKPRPYDARGLLQPSSRQADGQRLFALIGPDGATIAYLDVPPGLDPSPVVGHRVGVRGDIHFNEELNARLFAVRDLDDLGD